MSAPYYVELLGANGEVLQRQRYQQLPIRIGRAYDNDLILDDAHSGAHHASVNLNERGELLMTDLGSQNGSIYQGHRISQLVLGGNTVVRLGHTRLRIRAADFPVAPEVPDTTMHGWEGTAPALVGLTLIALFTGLENWIGDTEPFQLIRYLLVIATGLAVGLIWSGGWALANRLFGVHARLGRHLFILGCGLFAVGIWRVLANVMAYAWSAELLTRYGNLVSIALVCGMLSFHLRTIKPHHPRRALSTSAILWLGGCGLVLMTNLQSTGRTADELYMSVLLPPSLRHSPDQSVDAFLAGAPQLKQRADAARNRSVKNSGDDSVDDDSEE